MTNRDKAVLIRRIAAEHPQWPTRLVLHVASREASGLHTPTTGAPGGQVAAKQAKEIDHHAHVRG